MELSFNVIAQDFSDNLSAIQTLLDTFDGPGAPNKVRIASANSAILLLASTYEEFIRQMAREYARVVVETTAAFEDIPISIVETAWQRTLDGAARVKALPPRRSANFQSAVKEVQPKLDAVIDFVLGDKSQDIYDELIHNQNNMRPNEMNGLFRVSGLKNVCRKICDNVELREYFGEDDEEKTHGLLLSRLESFFQTRNEIAHSLNPRSFVAPHIIRDEIRMFHAVGQALNYLLLAKSS